MKPRLLTSVHLFCILQTMSVNCYQAILTLTVTCLEHLVVLTSMHTLCWCFLSHSRIETLSKLFFLFRLTCRMFECTRTLLLSLLRHLLVVEGVACVAVASFFRKLQSVASGCAVIWTAYVMLTRRHLCALPFRFCGIIAKFGRIISKFRSAEVCVAFVCVKLYGDLFPSIYGLWKLKLQSWCDLRYSRLRWFIVSASVAGINHIFICDLKVCFWFFATICVSVCIFNFDKFKIVWIINFLSECYFVWDCVKSWSGDFSNICFSYQMSKAFFFLPLP